MSASTSAPMRLVLCPTIAMLRSSRLEFQRDTVDAVAQMGWWGPIVENVAKMAAAAAAMDLVSNHTVASIRLALDRAGQWIVETWPAGSALELHFGNKQRLITSSTPKSADAFFMQ